MVADGERCSFGRCHFHRDAPSVIAAKPMINCLGLGVGGTRRTFPYGRCSIPDSRTIRSLGPLSLAAHQRGFDRVHRSCSSRRHAVLWLRAGRAAALGSSPSPRRCVWRLPCCGRAAYARSALPFTIGSRVSRGRAGPVPTFSRRPDGRWACFASRTWPSAPVEPGSSSCSGRGAASPCRRRTSPTRFPASVRLPYPSWDWLRGTGNRAAGRGRLRGHAPGSGLDEALRGFPVRSRAKRVSHQDLWMLVRRATDGGDGVSLPGCRHP